MVAIANIIELTDDNYDQIVNSKNIILVDITGSWCGPCKQMEPSINQLSMEFADQITFGKLDVDANHETAKKLNIRNIPAILIYKGGNLVEESIGLKSKSDLKKIIQRVLEKE